MNGAERISLAALAATLAAGVPMFTVTQDRSYLFLGLLLMAASVAIGAVVRRVGGGEITTRFAQFLPVLLLPWLVPALRNPWKLAAETIDYVQQAFAPMPYQEGFAVFTATMLWVVFLVVETLTNGLRSPAWTFPVLVMPYAVCALAIYTETNPFLFAFPAIGFIAVLGTSVRNDALAALPEAQANLPQWRTGVTRAAATAGGLALVASVLLSVPIAERSANAANPSGSGAVLLGDPSLDLIRNVTAASDQKVISYTTSDTGGQYLRLAALPAFDDRGFHLTRTELIQLPLRDDPPEVLGASSVSTSVKVDNLASEYLPMPWVPTRADLADNWRYDPATLAVVAIGDNRRGASRNLEYTVTSARVPDVESWLPAVADAGRPGDDGMTLDLPDEISPAIRQLAEQVTAGSAHRRGEGSRPAQLPALQRLHLQHDRHPRYDPADPRRLPARQPPRLLRAVRGQHGGDGAHGRHPVASGDRLPARQEGGTALGDHHTEHARLDRALLRRRHRLGADGRDAARCGRRADAVGQRHVTAQFRQCGAQREAADDGPRRSAAGPAEPDDRRDAGLDPAERCRRPRRTAAGGRRAVARAARTPLAAPLDTGRPAADGGGRLGRGAGRAPSTAAPTGRRARPGRSQPPSLPNWTSGPAGS